MSSIYVVWAQHMKGCESKYVKAFTDKSLAMFTNQTMGTFANPFMSKIRSGGCEYSVDLGDDVKHVYVVMCMMFEDESAFGAFTEEREAFDYIKKLNTNEKWITFRIVQVEINRSRLI